MVSTKGGGHTRRGKKRVKKAKKAKKGTQKKTTTGVPNEKNTVNGLGAMLESMSISVLRPGKPTVSISQTVRTGPKGVQSYFVDPRGRVSRSGRSIKVPKNVLEAIEETASARSAKVERAKGRAAVDDLADMFGQRLAVVHE